MASKYIKKFKVPNGFENILSDFAKEILRNQPKDILQFGIEYFKGLETNTKIDYTGKGENRPEIYKRPENQQPNIINAPNNLEMSYGDRNRLERSMEKIERINGEPATGYELEGPRFEHGLHVPHGPHGGPEYGPHGPHGPHGGPEFGGEYESYHREQQLSTQNEYERGRHIAKYETEEHHERKIVKCFSNKKYTCFWCFSKNLFAIKIKKDRILIRSIFILLIQNYIFRMRISNGGPSQAPSELIVLVCRVCN